MVRGQRSVWMTVLSIVAFAFISRAAGPFAVNTINDTHAVNPAASPVDGSGNISLRSAIEAANAEPGPTTITVPAGTFNLTLGELDLAPLGAKTSVITGAGVAGTVINQTDPTNRVFNIDLNSAGSTMTTLSGLTIQGGHDGADLLGGAGILAGSVTATPKDVLTLTNCMIQNNHCTTATTTQPGGGIQMAGGDLNITSCIFSNNSSGQSFGGAIFTLAQSVISSLNVTNSLFVNNSMTNNSGAGPDGGGAIMIETPAGSVHNVVACVFTNNHVAGISGNTYGGAIQMNGGALNITTSTFVSNSVTGAGGLGGAIYADSGSETVTGCRLTGNSASNGGSAIYNHGSNGASTTAINDWWGCNGGPGATGCDVVAGDGSAPTLTPWLMLTASANPATINMGQSTTLTATVLKNSNGQTLSASQLPVLIGLPLVWNPGPHGFLGGQQLTVQANGQATALFTNDNTCNSGAPTITLDNGTATAAVAVQCPDLTILITNNVNNSVAAGSPWTWIVQVTNASPAPATFPVGSVIVLDNLPTTNLTYGVPGIFNSSGVSGTMLAGIASDNLAVTASGPVTINGGGSFTVQFTAMSGVPGTYVNPQPGGVCKVDPNQVISESNEGNNLATNTVVVTCPTIAAAITGNTTVCPNSQAMLTVSVVGGVPPYTVTLNNGGGTQVGSSPLTFFVSPAATTTYGISSSSDAFGCPMTDSGGFTVTVPAVPTPAITLSPSSALANSGGNQASVPAVFSSYAWTITNGTIIGPANQPVVHYVAGISNNVSLGVAVVSTSGCDASGSAVVPIITGFSTHPNVVFTDVLASTTMGLTFDGTNYWSCSGGGPTGVRLASYSLTGVMVTNYSPGLDFRSLFIGPGGIVMARAFNTNAIYEMTNPGAFAPSGVTLSGGALSSQDAVVLNGAGTEFDVINSGVISRWSTNGSYLGTVNLTGFGTVPGENVYPQNRSLAAMDNLWLTYNGTNLVSIWDTSGNRLTELTLPGTGTNFDSQYSFSYANRKVFIVDKAGSSWRGFDLYSAARVAVYGAPAVSSWNNDVQGKIGGTGLFPAVDAFLVSGTNLAPNLATLRNYQAVLVYSDADFGDGVNLGNVLADYLDQGGGVAVGTFAFYNPGRLLGLQGRVATNGDSCFTSGGQTNEGNLTLVKDLPQHPLLDSVNTFNGGGSSFHNFPITNAPGATQVAHWSDSQILVGGKVDGFGHFAGLNFYPPSSDVLASSWNSSTDGARLMANALLWSGNIPARILSAPANQELPLGTTAIFSVAAVGTSPLSYQWRFNGTNLPAATNTTLSIPVQAGQFGAYSVVVSNLYGTTASLNASLNPPLRFLTPIVSSGTFSLYLVDVDGSAVAASRAAHINLYSSPTLAVPFSLWSLLTNPVVPSGTQLRADGFTATNGPTRYYRALEMP